ncbi:MAG: hypothetical protein EXS25_02420 [Pedosphaera sp.]|nr:hypothetical protein [Pedosphaera sp.]
MSDEADFPGRGRSSEMLIPADVADRAILQRALPAFFRAVRGHELTERNWVNLGLDAMPFVDVAIQYRVEAAIKADFIGIYLDAEQDKAELGANEFAGCLLVSERRLAVLLDDFASQAEGVISNFRESVGRYARSVVVALAIATLSEPSAGATSAAHLRNRSVLLSIDTRHDKPALQKITHSLGFELVPSF